MLAIPSDKRQELVWERLSPVFRYRVRYSQFLPNTFFSKISEKKSDQKNNKESDCQEKKEETRHPKPLRSSDRSRLVKPSIY